MSCTGGPQGAIAVLTATKRMRSLEGPGRPEGGVPDWPDEGRVGDDEGEWFLDDARNKNPHQKLAREKPRFFDGLQAGVGIKPASSSSLGE
jgi:hypothetical protein